MILFFSSNAKKPPYPPFGGQGGNKNIIFILTQKSPPTHLSVNRGAINIAETVVSSHYWDFCCRHWDLYCRYWDLEKTRDTSASTQPAKKKPRFQSTPQYSGSAGTAGTQIPLPDQPPPAANGPGKFILHGSLAPKRLYPYITGTSTAATETFDIDLFKTGGRQNNIVSDFPCPYSIVQISQLTNSSLF